jgi:predicted O-methyltransferase YrrM
MPAYGFSDLPPLLRELLETGQYRDASGQSHQLHSNISRDEAVALYALVCALRPRASAEIGFALGVSGLAILGALAANGGASRHHVADPQQTSLVANQGLEHVRRAGFSALLDFHEQFPEAVFPALPPLQFAFIDASHLYDLSILDFLLVDKRLDVGGVVGFHDLWMPSLQKVVRYILANRAYRIHPASYAIGSPSSANPSASPPPPSLSTRIKHACRHLPRAENIFSPEFLHPWADFHLGNMVFLEKTAPDTRDWRHHVAF